MLRVPESPNLQDQTYIVLPNPNDCVIVAICDHETQRNDVHWPVVRNRHPLLKTANDSSGYLRLREALLPWRLNPHQQYPLMLKAQARFQKFKSPVTVKSKRPCSE